MGGSVNGDNADKGDQKQEQPTPENTTLFQGFEWNIPADQGHWKRTLAALPGLKEIGISNIWLPPGCKAQSPEGNGYDVYDLYDLGEFEAPSGKPTKWGTKEELVELCNKAKELGVGIYWDAVLNHKAGADDKETFQVVDVDQEDRTKEISEPHDITGYTKFTFPGRKGKYSKQQYNFNHFSGVDYDDKTGDTGIFKILGDDKMGWADDVSDEQGNADYMMFADLDYRHGEVVEDVKNWGGWITNELGLAGFRFDAVQHFSQRFSNAFMHHVDKESGSEKFFVGEYWTSNADEIIKYSSKFDHRICFYDSPLVYNFSNISTSADADMRKVFDKSLVSKKPQDAVTVVMNHDTQPGQTVETPIEAFFKPLAYCLILLREQGYPCVFYGDLYGMKGENPEDPACGGSLSNIILARHLYAYGSQDDYWDNPNCIGWVRHGTWDKPAGCAVVLSNTKPGRIRMAVGDLHRGEVWTDVLGWEKKEVTIGDDGFGEFDCPGTSCSIYVNKEAKGRDRFGKFDDDIYKK